ncbi:helix-turn-helix domain-containing protein [uncultured Gemella sp.]|uniref:helix-turn-helix domain-containing protein n=1 Tax=uncultured Gemella sp. TaxID=254352 RepID=UPI0025FFE731|nr:hypothetical protein [uncultured Gemella sp.]
MTNKSIHGKVFKELRLERGVKLKDAAGEVISAQTLRRFEADETSVSLVVFEKLLGSLGIGYIEYLTELLPRLESDYKELTIDVLKFARVGNYSGMMTHLVRKLKDDKITLSERLFIAVMITGYSGILPEKFKENNKILLKYFQGIEMLSLNEKAALNGIITTSSTKEIPLEFVRRTIADSLGYNPDVEGINIISTIITFRVLHSSIGFLLRSGNCNEAEEVCKKVIEILDLIDITLSHIKPTFAVHTYILLAQIKLAQNKVEGVELANKCIRQIDASIDLYNSTKEINNRKDYVDRFYELNKTGVEFDF